MIMRKKHTRSERVLAGAALYALLATISPAQQQQGQQNQQGTPQSSPQQQVNPLGAPPPPPPAKSNTKTFVTESNLVQIDTFVTDRDGKPVKGLSKENFQIDEDGKSQKLTAADYFDIETIETAAKSDDAAPVVVSLHSAPDPTAVREVVRDRRLIVLFFDLTSMQPQELLRSTDSAKKFIKQQMSPADLVAIVSFGNLLVLKTDFTNDRDQLFNAVDSLIPGKESNLATNAASAGDTVTEDNGSSFTADDTEFNTFNTDRKLAAMESLAGMLGSIPGRKSVMQFTGGITQSGEDNRSELQFATIAANKNNVSFYTVDARGLMTDTPGGDASTGMASGNATFSGVAVHQGTQSRQGSRDTLTQLAEDTGGKAFLDEGDLGDTFKKVEAETTGYYLLSYSSTNTAKDGRYRRVKVKLVNVNVPGAHLRYREGYNAPKDWKIFNTDDREKALDDAMSSSVPRVELPMALETGEFRLPNNEVYVPLAVKLSSSALQWAKSHGKHETQFDFLAELRDVNTRRIAGQLRDTIKVTLADDRFQQVQQQSLVYQGGILTNPGQYNLKVLARENESGKIGTFEQKLIIPPMLPNKMRLSSVVLSSQIVALQKTNEVDRKAIGSDARMKTSPLDVNGERIIPSVTRVFTDQSTIYVFFQAYLPQKEDATNLRAGLIFFRNGKRLSDSPMFAAADFDEKTHTASFRISLPVDKFSNGGYTVEAEVVQADGSHVAFAKNYFAVRRPAAAPAAAPGPSGPQR
jgi:VWFA-related protein